MPTGVFFRTDEFRKKLSKALSGSKNPFFARKHSPETIAKIIAAKTGVKQSEYTIAKRVSKCVGAKRTPEMKARMSAAQKGRVVTPEHASKIVASRRAGDNYKLSIESRKKISDSNKGDKCHLWKGGITPENQRIRWSFEMKEWKRSVFNRDNFTCQVCNEPYSGKLNAHHINPFAKFPELRMDVDNGMTLCQPCHLYVHRTDHAIS